MSYAPTDANAETEALYRRQPWYASEPNKHRDACDILEDVHEMVSRYQPCVLDRLAGRMLCIDEAEALIASLRGRIGDNSTCAAARRGLYSL